MRINLLMIRLAILDFQDKNIFFNLRMKFNKNDSSYSLGDVSLWFEFGVDVTSTH